ncbi:MAG: tripartite tricarboxylate transporter substrate-binding protein [Betaproteobacteria bacterium]
MAIDAARHMKKWGLTSWPDKPLRFYVGFPPGGSTDIISRFLGQRLQERLKQPVVVEQKVGATGTIANDAVAKSAPDGTTMLLLTGGHPGTAAIMKSLPYDPVAGFGMGPGSLHHLLGEWMNVEAGTSVRHVPFKGAAPAFTELLGGRIDVLIETAAFAIPQIERQ